MTFKHAVVTAPATSTLAITTAAAVAQDARELNVVGTWGVSGHWRDREDPFRSEVARSRLTLSKNSDDGHRARRTAAANGVPNAAR